MGFNEDYIKIRRLVKDRLFNIRVPAEVDEVINNGYLRFVASKEPYNLDGFIKFCFIDNVKPASILRQVSEYVAWDKSDYKTCKICKEVYPIDFFYTIHRNDGYVIKSPYCKYCSRAKCAADRIKNLNKRRETDKNKKREVYSDIKNDKEAYRAYRKWDNERVAAFYCKTENKQRLTSRQNKDRSELSDWYVKAKLKEEIKRKKKLPSKSQIIITDKMIRDKRKKMLSNRKSKLI